MIRNEGKTKKKELIELFVSKFSWLMKCETGIA